MGLNIISRKIYSRQLTVEKGRYSVLKKHINLKIRFLTGINTKMLRETIYLVSKHNILILLTLFDWDFGVGFGWNTEENIPIFRLYLGPLYLSVDSF